MSLIRRLCNCETTNIKQNFVYTLSILKTLALEPDLVVPICTQLTFDSRTIMSATEGFLRRNGIRRPLSFGTIRLFNVHNSEALFFKSYVLIYGYRGNKSKLDCNLIHKMQFTHDIILQAGSLCT